MGKKLTDAHIQILGAAANRWLSGSHGWDDVFFISTWVRNENGKQLDRGLKSNPRPATVNKLIKDGLLDYPRRGGDLALTEKGREAFEADERTVQVVAGSKLQVVLKNPPATVPAVDLTVGR
ncbi:hypothetical protein [Kitasatospora sp. NPDC098663]|uniref:hypothetical protein n=1 Tax=Kitasatospora sp. NPDC098663 TaxID=3364096 RepID=UPI003823B0C4